MTSTIQAQIRDLKIYPRFIFADMVCRTVHSAFNDRTSIRKGEACTALGSRG